jgi:hypothetical protein
VSWSEGGRPFVSNGTVETARTTAARPTIRDEGSCLALRVGSASICAHRRHRRARRADDVAPDRQRPRSVHGQQDELMAVLVQNVLRSRQFGRHPLNGAPVDPRPTPRIQAPRDGRVARHRQLSERRQAICDPIPLPSFGVWPSESPARWVAGPTLGLARVPVPTHQRSGTLPVWTVADGLLGQISEQIRSATSALDPETPAVQAFLV